jgi:hypothetical protein
MVKRTRTLLTAALTLSAGCVDRLIVEESGFTSVGGSSGDVEPGSTGQPQPTTDPSTTSPSTTGPVTTTATVTTASPTTTGPDPTGVDPGDSGDPGAEPGPGTVIPQLCPEVVSESVYCLTTNGSELFVMGMDSDSYCGFGPFDFGALGATVAWIEDRLYVCSDSRVGMLDLLTGVLTDTGIPCSSLANRGSTILVQGPISDGQSYRFVSEYLSFEDLYNGEPISVTEFQMQATRIAHEDGILYAAWHSDNLLQRFDYISSDPYEDLYLQGHDDWFHGLSLIGERVFVLTTSSQWREFNLAGELVQAGVVDIGGSSIFECRAGGV